MQNNSPEITKAANKSKIFILFTCRFISHKMKNYYLYIFVKNYETITFLSNLTFGYSFTLEIFYCYIG